VARQRLVDRVGPRKLAEAITAPSAVLLAAGGASVAILAGAPIALAAAAGAVVWAARVALGLPRPPRREPIEPGRLVEPWRSAVQDALQAQRRFDDAVRACAPGPLRERLTGLGDRIDDGVRECWRVARRGQSLEHAVAALEPEELARELAAARAGGASQADAAASLEEALNTAKRLSTVARDAQAKLRLLNARLEEAVAQAVELSLEAGDHVDVGSVGSNLDEIVSDLGALRAALDETGGAGTGAGTRGAAGAAGS